MDDEIERYIRHGQVSGWSAASVELYRSELVAAVAFLRRRGCRRLADVAPADLDAYMQHLLDAGRARNSRMHSAATVRRFFRWLQDGGKIVSCPARALPVPEDGEEELPQAPLSEAEVQAVFDGLPRSTVADLRNRCLLELLYGCGLRRAECVALDVDDIDCSRRTLHVRNGKGCQERLMPVMPTALAAVKDYLAVRRTLLQGPDHGALLVNRDGRRLGKQGIAMWFRALNAGRGPEAPHLHPHLFRHSIAVHLLRGGADIRYIQQFLGHSSLDTTKIYLRLVPGRLQEDYDEAMPEIAVGLQVTPSPGPS